MSVETINRESCTGWSVDYERSTNLPAQGRSQGVLAGAMAPPLWWENFLKTPLDYVYLTAKFAKIYVYGPLQVL